MSTVLESGKALVAAGNTIQLSEPLPKPRSFTLLDTVEVVPPADDLWLRGGWIEGFPPGPASTHDPCSSGTDRVKNPAGQIATEVVSPFMAYLFGKCTAQSVGPEPTFWTDRLRLAFEAIEATAVERVLATGDGHATSPFLPFGPFLGNANMKALASGAAQPPVEGLALLENEIARVGSGIIHATPAVATTWAAQSLLVKQGAILYTIIGTPVVVGAGYIGATPVGKSPVAGQEWAYASGLISITRDLRSRVEPARYSEAFDRNLNDVEFMAERPYLINWIGRQDSSDPDHIQAGVLIDRTP